MSRRQSDIKTTRVSTDALSVAVVITAVARFLPFAFPEARLWGTDMLRDAGTGVTVAWTAAMLLLLIPGIRKAVSDTADRITERAARLLFIFIFATVAPVVLLNPVRTIFSGDGSMLVAEVHKLGSDPGYASDILLNLRSSPLAGLLLTLLTKWTPEFLHAFGLSLPATSLFPFTILGLLCLPAFAAAHFFVRDAKRRLMVFIACLGCGGSLLFFGWVEYYAVVYVAFALYLFAAERAAAGEGKLWPVSVAFLIACASHYYTLALLPSYLFLLALRKGMLSRITSSTRNTVLVSCALLAVACAGFITVSLTAPYNRVMIPLSPVATEAGIQAYTAFSPEHLMDLVNIVLLLAPVPAFYIAAALLMKKRTSGKSDTVFRFHITVVLFFLAFLLFANTGFGLARDWDLAAPLGILLTVPAMRLAGIGGKRSNTDRSIMPLAMLLSALPWLIVQLGDESSARRFERVVELDSDIMFADYALSGFEALRKHYVHSEEIDDEIRIEKRMVERLGYPEHYRLLLKSSLTLTPSQPERATEHLNWMLERLHKQISGLLDKRVDRDYAMSMEQADSISTAVAYQAYFFGLHPGLNGKFNELEKLGLKTPGIVIKGMDAFAAERYQDALNLTKSAFERGFMTGKLAALHANSLLMLGRTAEAEASFDVALNRFPADPELRYLAAYGYLVKGINTARARRLLEEAAGMDATDELRAEINSLLEKLRAAGFTSPP